MKNNYGKLAKEILGFAGIQIDGSHPWDIQVHNQEFYKRAITEGPVGVGESYMDGWWDVEKLDEFISKIVRARLDLKIQRKVSVLFRLATLRIINLQSKERAFIVGEKHYDLGNDLFQNMLDPLMNYSCGYWKNATNLKEAQENKLHLICQKLYLQPGMRVLDIGCGWGAFGKYAAEKYKVEVVGVTVSKEQLEFGEKLCTELPVEFRLMDYRELNEQFDRVVSVGMFEHVGEKNYRTYFEVANRCLKDDGLFLLHTIGRIRSPKVIDPWTHKYIFPNAQLPSAIQIDKAIEGLFVMEDWHNFGPDYDKTLMAWHENFIRNWDKIKSQYSERFFRMWTYYLLSSAGSFRARRNQLWQVVLSKNGIPGGYQSLR
ncbi:MAG TPA: cyclopropane fatty acyl phospholipid synthase [Prolixibacteraceae bacterium]|nr:cyclopropane fatty acyl phospholipid synthase [Prolixibacteraceae bacterium]